MIQKLTVSALLFLLLFQSYGQDKKAIKFAKSISEDDLKAHLSVLAADSLEGRETGMPGQKKAAHYIAAHFEQFDLQPPVQEQAGDGYFQTFELERGVFNQVYLQKGDEKKWNFEDFLFYSRNETYGEEYIDVVFTGYGDTENLEGVDLEGKYVAFVNKEFSNFRTTLSELKKAKAKGYILIIEDEFQFDFVMNRYGGYMKSPKMDFDFDQSGSKILLAGKEMTEWIFGSPFEELMKSGIGQTTPVLINADMHISRVTSENVLGFLEGSEKPDEVLVITAHYDHVGIIDGEIHNGADDDGSGTSSLLEIAEAFSLAAKKGFRPKRSVLFMTVSGEEKGLLGSKYYVNNPVFPLENTVTDLNIDMVGRVDNKHQNNPDYVYLIGSDKLSSELHKLSERVNKSYSKMELDYTYNADDDPNRYYYRSDHYNFAKNGIPVIFYYNGTHEDYHKPTDTIEKINFEALEKRTKLVFYTAWELANRENRVKLD